MAKRSRAAVRKGPQTGRRRGEGAACRHHASFRRPVRYAGVASDLRSRTCFSRKDIKLCGAEAGRSGPGCRVRHRHHRAPCQTKVAPEGRVHGVDASAEMVARATAKARRAGLQVGFSTATAQELPFKDGEFDVVLSTLMFHHLPKKGREEFGREAFRVLRPGGRVLIVDFAKPPRQKSTFQLHRHGYVDLDKVAADLGRHGFNIVEQGDVGTKGLRYLVAQPDLSLAALEAR
ncbi:methyltransferase domain-containing protein [Mesorhizobium sp. M0208]|uniref:class I SAM-dependent methyltransferase n=1 Tax=Mesorhizobium sp. M0208 TaxID=2956916 RepID=UPI00333D4F4C